MSSSVAGTSREEEEKKLKDILDIAERRLESTKGDVRNLESELHAMQQEFDEDDREQQARWHNTDARFREMRHELQRVLQARKKPYFGRIDVVDHQIGREESFYIGRSVISEDPAHPEVIDWRAPIAGVYYDSSLGETAYQVKGEGRFDITLNRKRTYEIESDVLKDFYDSDTVANDELLTKYLAKNKRAVLGEIIATIQQEQNEVIRRKPQHNLIVQGAAGSGKTTVAMHRISYILYNYDVEFKPEDFYIIGSNKVLLNYITGVLPELNVYGVSQMTMEELFVRLLYEDWDKKKYSIRPVIKGVTEPVKGTFAWFHDLECFCRDYERSIIPAGDVILEKNHTRLLSGDTIERLLNQFEKFSRADKITMLTERLMAKLENELCGRYYSYTAEEKKKLTRQYSTYFGKREWKGSIFDLYDAFLDRQWGKGMQVAKPEGCFDVYDLAALAYIYKRIRETEIIREAGHVVIDEAQDFGMMAYGALKYCLSTCTFTIMGDVSQNIFIDYGLNDWQELRGLMLPGEFDYFGLLRKSYRNTVEISEYATNILQHGEFQIYPVQPIIRHGEDVVTEGFKDGQGMLKKAAETIRNWQEKGLETIAVICSDQEQADQVSAELEKQGISLLSGNGMEMEFGVGVLVLPLEYTKGLEFDAVLIYDASADRYPVTDGCVKRLYVAATRALHELAVYYQGELTELIGKPVPEDKKQNVVTESTKPARKPLPKEEDRTVAEIARDRAARGDVEKADRQSVGPRRIVISTGRVNTGTANTGVPTGKTQGTGSVSSDAGRISDRKPSTLGNAMVPNTSGNLSDRRLSVQKPSATATARTAASGQSSVWEKEVLRSSGKLPSYYEQMMAGKTDRREKDEAAIQRRKQREFGSMPDQQELKIAGHSKVNCGVSFCMKGKNTVDIYSSYGVLQIMVISSSTVRICFTKGNVVKAGPVAEQFAGKNGAFRYKDGRDSVEILTEKLQIRVMKKTGEIRFLNEKGVLLLSEKEKEPRLAEAGGSYTFFEWDKKENLVARTPDKREPVLVGQSAKYISFGEESDGLPGLSSNRGYELIFPASRKTLCCNITMYGNYIWQEGAGTEYYFRV